MKALRPVGRVIGRLFPNLSANLRLFSEACREVGAHYKDLSVAQKGETQAYVVACWLRGVNRSEFDRLKGQLGSVMGATDESNGIFSTAGIPRKTALVVMNVEAPNAHRAASRCFGALMEHVEPLGIKPASVAVEAEEARVLEEGLEIEHSEVPA